MPDSEFFRSACVLQVKDVIASEAFYRKLGFTAGGFWGDPPCFCITGRDTVTVFLDQTQKADDAAPVNQYWASYIYVSDVDALAEEIKANGVEIIRGPEDAPHGCREIDVRDPDGHIIAFGQDLMPGPEGPGL